MYVKVHSKHDTDDDSIHGTLVTDTAILNDQTKATFVESFGKAPGLVIKLYVGHLLLHDLVIVTAHFITVCRVLPRVTESVIFVPDLCLIA